MMRYVSSLDGIFPRWYAPQKLKLNTESYHFCNLHMFAYNIREIYANHMKRVTFSKAP